MDYDSRKSKKTMSSYRTKGQTKRENSYDTRGKRVSVERIHHNTENTENSQDSYRQYEYKMPVNNNRPGKNEQNDNYILTGRNPIREALKNHHDLEKLLVQKGDLSGSAKEIVQKAKEQKIQIQVVEKSRLDAIAPNHQGLIAFASAYQYSSVEDILETASQRGEAPFIILLDGITDPHNLGAVIRSAEAGGASCVVYAKRRSAIPNDTVIKTSAGASLRLPLIAVSNITRTIERFKESNFWTIGLDSNAEESLWAETLPGRCAIVIGAEGEGLSRLVKTNCDMLRKIPISKDGVSSLNASVAAALGIFEWSRVNRI